MKSNFRHILLPVLVGFLIFIVTCLLRSDDVPDLPQVVAWDKVAHYGMFFVLSAVSCSIITSCMAVAPGWDAGYFGRCSACYLRRMIELMQKYFFSTRSAEMADFVADLLGSATAVLIALFLYQRRRKQEKTIFVGRIYQIHLTI